MGSKTASQIKQISNGYEYTYIYICIYVFIYTNGTIIFKKRNIKTKKLFRRRGGPLEPARRSLAGAALSGACARSLGKLHTIIAYGVTSCYSIAYHIILYCICADLYIYIYIYIYIKRRST